MAVRRLHHFQALTIRAAAPVWAAFLMSSFTTRRRKKGRGSGIGATHNLVPSSVLQELDAGNNGFAVLHIRSGRSGAPAPRSLQPSALLDEVAINAVCRKRRIEQ